MGDKTFQARIEKRQVSKTCPTTILEKLAIRKGIALKKVLRNIKKKVVLRSLTMKAMMLATIKLGIGTNNVIIAS